MKHFTVIEYDLEVLDEEAKSWLENDTTDLVLLKPDFRRRTILYSGKSVDSPFGRDKYKGRAQPLVEVLSKYYNGYYGPHILFSQVDAILFASTADAVYFKLRFM